VNYIHYNPVKHGLVNRPVDWPYSSIHRAIRQGIMPADWGGDSIDIPDSIGNPTSIHKKTAPDHSRAVDSAKMLGCQKDGNPTYDAFPL
jgi:hypothetical protein